MSASQKSRGGGTIALLVVLFLAIAGGSAWIIHTVLNGEDPPFIGDSGGTTPPAGTSSAQGNSAQPSPGVLTPLPPATNAGGTPVQGGETGTASVQNGATLPGGVVVESIPGGTAESGTGISGETLPPPVSSPLASNENPERENTPDQNGTPAANLLVAPVSSVSQPAQAGEDAVVRPAFVDDIATFLAQNYWPKGTHPSAKNGGITTASLRWANLRYGAGLRSLDGRQAVLQYVLTPAMVGRLYSMYADSFASSLVRGAESRSVGEGSARRFLTGAEKKEMFTIYSSYAARVSGALERYAATPGMAAKVEAYAKSESLVEEANKVYIESVIAYENSVEGNDNNVMTTARLKRDKEAATYQKRIREREAAHTSLVTAMSGGKAGGGSRDTLVYVAFWAYRRGADSAPALKACAKALSDMSAKLSATAKNL